MTKSDADPLHAQYTLINKSDILEKLRLLENNNNLLSALPNGASSGFATSIVKVVQEKALLALASGNDQNINRTLLDADYVSFHSQMNGIEVRFQADKIIEARLHGRDVLAVPIPSSLLWLQRRQYYRLPVPYSMFFKCRLSISGEEIIDSFDVSNVSLIGLSLQDDSDRLSSSGLAGKIIRNCRLELAGFEKELFSLEIRHRQERPRAEQPIPSIHVGFKVQDSSPTFEKNMQKFLFQLERELKNSE